MGRIRVSAIWGLGLLLASASTVMAGSTLKFGTSSPAMPTMGQTVSIPIVLDSDGDVQGFVIAVDWNEAFAKVWTSSRGGAGGADVVVPRIADSYACSVS